MHDCEHHGLYTIYDHHECLWQTRTTKVSNQFSVCLCVRTKLAGKFSTTVRSLTTDREVEAEFLVLENNSNSRPLLSLTTGVNLGIISIANAVTGTPLNKDQLKREFPSAFNGFGKNTKIKAKYIEDTSVTPITQKPKRVPYNLKKRTMEEEDRLIAQDIIEMVPDDVPTTWCTNPVIAPKRHDREAIRYCSYMRAPNTAIKRPITEALTIEDIKVRLEGSKVFSILDMNKAYHQLELCEEIVTWQHSVARVVEWDIKDWITVASQPRTSSIKPWMTPSTDWMGYYTSETTSSFMAVPRRNMTHDCVPSWHVWWKTDWPSHSRSAKSVCQR